ncbi:MAG: GIY-YIG nuclease family protein [Nitrospira sp.]
MHYLYILLSETKSQDRTYTGVTESIEKRLKEHNSGRVKSSRPYRPYKILCTQVFPTLIEARQAERFYKSTAGRRRLKQMISTLENDTR